MTKFLAPVLAVLLLACGSAAEPEPSPRAALLGNPLESTVFRSVVPGVANALVEQVSINTAPDSHVFDGTFPHWDISGASVKIVHPTAWAPKNFVIRLSAGATPWPHYGINCTIYPLGTYPGVDWTSIGIVPSSWELGPGLNFAGVYGDGVGGSLPLGRNSINSFSTCSAEGGEWGPVDPAWVTANYVPASGNYFSPKVLTSSTRPGRVQLRVDVMFWSLGVVNRYIFDLVP